MSYLVLLLLPVVLEHRVESRHIVPMKDSPHVGADFPKRLLLTDTV